jgi:hypothetical protein
MEGWHLVLGGDKGSADTSLQPQKPAYWGEQIVDLTPIVGGRLIDRRLLTGKASEVVSMVTLRAGRVENLHSSAEWHIGGKEIAMALRVTWKIDAVDDKLHWISIGSGHKYPLDSLAELKAPKEDVVRIEIAHELEESILSRKQILSVKEVQEHVTAYYRLYGVEPSSNQLPDNPTYWGNSELSGGKEEQKKHTPKRDNRDFKYGCPTIKGSVA